jgi:hypothetical protein
MNLSRLRSIIWKEFVQMRRDRATLGSWSACRSCR